ncbi:hypothetical protein KFS98_003652 [Salmonella enterica]|nr:hypothetical protein [Salmonella enterica]
MKWHVLCINKQGKTETVEVDVENSTKAMAEAKKLGYKPIRVKTSAPRPVAA